MKVGLALGSGGARGIAHIAYLEVLDQLLVKTTVISGASIGALIGALYASGMSGADIRSIATGFTIRDLPKLLDAPALNESMGIKGRKIEEWLRGLLPVKNFEDLPIPLKVVATDYWGAEQHVFSTGDIAQAVRASISIPGAFQPYAIDGRVYVDGGVVNPVPFDLIGGIADFIVAIDVAGEQESEEIRVPGPIETLLGTYSIMGKAIMERSSGDRRISVYRAPRLGMFKVADFLKAHEILDSVRGDAEEFRRQLVAAKVDRKARRE